MTIDSFLNFLFKYNTTVIEVLIASVLVLLILLALRLFISAKEPKNTGLSSGSLADLEVSLKKILEQAGGVPSNSQVSAAVATDNPEAKTLVEEINKLKEELTVKVKEVETLKATSAANPSAAGPGVSAGDKGQLDDKIRDLQAKLSEYEIISEDIADLSFYKEQNARLTKELEAFKGQAPGSEASAPAEAVPTADEPAIVGKSKATEPAVEAPAVPVTPEATPASDIMAQAAAAIAAGTAAPPAPEAPVENIVDDNLMAEFNAAVESQKIASGEAPSVPAAAKPGSATAAPKAETTVVAGEVPEEGADLGDMDMEKMLAEAANITTNGPDVSAEEALGTGVDENKILQEANAIGVSSEDKKLMGDFENFVKKGS